MISRVVASSQVSTLLPSLSIVLFFFFSFLRFALAVTSVFSKASFYRCIMLRWRFAITTLAWLGASLHNQFGHLGPVNWAGRTFVRPCQKRYKPKEVECLQKG